MSHSLTPDFSSAQPRPKQTLAVSPPSSPHPTPQSKPDDINTPFEVLNSDSVCEPYNTDQSSQPEFERAVAEGLLHLMMNVRAWSEARPAYEAAQEKTHIISEVRAVENREREQGMSIPFILESIRQRLVGFVASVQSALNDLQG
ncbi:hypothetical protein BDV93DRAFT_134866 [Ceratobasidium sp. AG-I]|nr:hypothetical protein BDV93DRAFT_134866 [Ceratobasidium sp. AG-I]